MGRARFKQLIDEVGLPLVRLGRGAGDKAICVAGGHSGPIRPLPVYLKQQVVVAQLDFVKQLRASRYDGTTGFGVGGSRLRQLGVDPSAPHVFT